MTAAQDHEDRLAADRNLAYTSAATILRILEQKGFVTSEKKQKTLIYEPVLKREAYQSKTLRNISDKLFDGTPASLVARLVDDDGSDRALVDAKTEGYGRIDQSASRDVESTVE